MQAKCDALCHGRSSLPPQATALRTTVAHFWDKDLDPDSVASNKAFRTLAIVREVVLKAAVNGRYVCITPYLFLRERLEILGNTTIEAYAVSDPPKKSNRTP